MVFENTTNQLTEKIKKIYFRTNEPHKNDTSKEHVSLTNGNSSNYIHYDNNVLSGSNQKFHPHDNNHETNPNRSTNFYNYSLHATNDIKHLSYQQLSSNQMASAKEHVPQNQYASILNKSLILSLPNRMQIEPTIIEEHPVNIQEHQ